MSGYYYAELSKGFDTFRPDTQNLGGVLKREVGIIQGVRIAGCKTNSSDESWVEENYCSKSEFDNPQAGGDECDITSVFKMDCRIYKPESPGSHYDDIMKSASERTLMAFCWQHGIPYLPGSASGKEGVYTQNNNGGEQKSSGNPNADGSKGGSKDSGKSQGGNSSGNPPNHTPSRSVIAGAAGGEKPPPNDDSSSSDTDFTASTVNLFETLPPTTTTVDPTTSMISLASTTRTRTKKFRKRRIIPLIKQAEEKAQSIPPPLSRAPSVTSMSVASTVQSVSTQSPKQRKFVRIKASEVDTEHLQIRTFSVTGKKQKTANLNQKAISMKKMKQNDFALPVAVKSKKIMVDQKPSTLRIHQQVEPSSKSIPMSYQESTIAPSEAVSFQIQGPPLPPVASRHVHHHQSQTHRIHHHHNHYQNQSTYTLYQKIVNKNKLRKEKNNEWLYWSNSDESMDEDAEEREKVRDPKTKGRPVDPDLHVFTGSLKWLDTLNNILGLNPYKRVVTSNKSIRVKWCAKSWNFFGVCLNATIFTMSTLSIVLSLIFFFSLKEPFSTSRAIVQDEFANNLSSTFFFVFISFFLSVWSISCILELGPCYAQYMTRFNLAICLLRYDVSEGLYKMVHRHLFGVAIFLTFIIILFFGGRAETSAVRESCGFLGFCILRPFDFKLRESVYYPLIELFGLLVFVHGFLCFNVVLLQFAVYGTALGNMAKCLNLRVAYALGKIVEFLPDGTSKRIKKVIPYQKLHAEHLIVASLFRNISQVNAIVFATFFLTMGLQIVLTVWMVFERFIENSPDPTNWFFESVGNIDIAVPLRVREFRTETVVAMFIQLDITMLTYWLFGGIFHLAGEYMQYCVEYVRRHGLMLCKSSNERRFILSMIVSNSPKNPYWIGRQFLMNRAFLVGFLSFVTAASMVTVSFHPKRTGLSTVEKCNRIGKCTSYKIAHGNLDILYAAVKIPLSEDAPVTEEPTTTTTRSPMDIAIDKYDSEIMFFPTCGSSSTLPFSSKEYISTCPATWQENGQAHLYPSKIKFPLFYTKVKYQGSKPQSDPIASQPKMITSPQKLFKRFKEPFIAWHDQRTSSCRSQVLGKLNVPSYSTHQLVNCFGEEVNSEDADDCGNLNSTTLHDGKAVSTSLRPVHIYGLKDISDDLLCCYHYPGIDEDSHQLKVCNMPNPTTYKAACKTGTRKSRMKDKRVLKHYKRLLSRLNYEKQKSGTTDFLNKNEERIKGCQCPPFKDVILNGCFCSAYYLPPCLEGYFTGAKEDYAISCGGVYTPLLYEMNIDNSIIFPARHIRLGNICPKAFPPGTVDYNYQLTTNANPIMSICANVLGTKFTLSDCSGARISHIKKDDCRNWNVLTPDAISGKMTPAHLTLRALNYNPALQKIMEDELNTKLFVCCFQYASQVFQTEAQMRFCNAPKAIVANSDNWCGMVAKIGIRNPTPFDLRIHQQLTKKLELTVEYKKKKGKRAWLYDKQVNLRWTMCLCSNKLEGITPKDFTGLKKQCILDIPPPHELHAENIIKVNLPCPHKWPRKKNIPELKTAAVFIFENEIWEMTDRFQKIGSSETSPCNKDYSFQERPRKGRGLPPIYDAYLEKVDLNHIDECHNLNIGVKPIGFIERKLPRLTLVLELGMNAYDPNKFKMSEKVYCCYHYETFGEQWRVCNMPDAQSVINRCKKTTDPIRKKHEKELVRKMLVYDKGAYELGNGITVHEHPDELSWDSEQEKKWKKCICERSPSNSDADDKECETLYLPPCIVPMTEEQYPSHWEETFTLCRTQWPTGWPATLHLPIILKHSLGVFIKEPLFRERSKSLDCPTAKALSVTKSLPNSHADCYGNLLSSVKHDECGNPNVPTPIGTDMTRNSLPTMWLIALNQIPGFSSDDQRFFCCFQYANGKANEVKVCNKPNKQVIEAHCINLTRSAQVSRFAQRLKEERLSGTDFLANNVDFNTAGRISWTKCICSAKLDTCKSLFPPGLKNPPCFGMTNATWLDRMFYECEVTEPKVGGHSLWKSVNRKLPFIYPIIFSKLGSERYKPLLTIKPKDCKPFNVNKPLLSETERIDLSVFTRVYDCSREKYDEKIDIYHADDLGNLVLRGPVQSKSGSWLQASEFRLVPLNTTYRFLCCVEYNRGNGFDDVSAKQAETCSMPNFKVMNRELKRIRDKFEDTNNYEEEMHESLHTKIKEMNERDRNKELRNPENIKCLCFHLKAVLNHKIYGIPDLKTCEKRFPGAKARRGGIWGLLEKLKEQLLGGIFG